MMAYSCLLTTLPYVLNRPFRREQFVVLHRSNSKLRVDLMGQKTSNFCHASSIAYFSFIVVGLPVKIARKSEALTWQSPGIKYVAAMQTGAWYQEIATSLRPSQ